MVELAMSHKNTPDSFWKRVIKTDSCWLWNGGLSSRRYGSIMYHGSVRRTHRLAWELTNGVVPDGLCVLHRCDVPRCVNPDHLFLGTHDDNMADMAAKGRSNPPKPTPGSQHPESKLTEQDVVEIRASKDSLTTLAKRYGVCFQNISMIRNRTRWRHVA